LLFNITGILIVYPFKPLRRLPIRMAQALAARTSEHRIYAILYMVGLFFVLPLIFVLITRAI
jgi:sodium-dependent phosphate cotransporter